MLVTHYDYGLIHADYATLTDGESLEAPSAYSNSRVYGVFVYSGTSTIIATDGDNLGQSWSVTGSFRPNDIDCAVTVQAIGETKWLCVSQNDNTRREVQELKVNESAVLPNGWSFLTLDGFVQADGKTVNQFEFFQSRPNDLDIQGTATLLLVR